jgi:hypothetical protein
MTKETKLRSHSITAKAAWKFGSKAWVVKERAAQRLETAQMKLLRHLLGITKLDWERNKSVRDKLGVQNSVQEIQKYQQQWLQHLQRMDKTNNQAGTAVSTKGRRNVGRPRTRWKDQLHLES